MTAHDLGIKSKVWVNRGHEPANPYYGYVEIKGISGSAGRGRSLRTGRSDEIRLLLARHCARFSGGTQGPVEGHYDVAVIGGGFTGLGAALQLAKAGAKVSCWRRSGSAGGASGRNGGHLNNGLAHSYLAAKAELRQGARGRALPGASTLRSTRSRR